MSDADIYDSIHKNKMDSRSAAEVVFLEIIMRDMG